jgi:hypothetical protein
VTGHRTDSLPSLYATFRPRFARVAGAITGTVVLVGCVVIAVAGTGPEFDVRQRVGIVVFGALCAWLVWMLVGVSARVSPHELTVRNIVRKRTLEWPEVVAVRFARDDPWVTLDLADGRTIAVMAVQRADGARGVREANRLARLVELNGEAPDATPGASTQPDGPPPE